MDSELHDPDTSSLTVKGFEYPLAVMVGPSAPKYAIRTWQSSNQLNFGSVSIDSGCDRQTEMNNTYVVVLNQTRCNGLLQRVASVSLRREDAARTAQF